MNPHAPESIELAHRACALLAFAVLCLVAATLVAFRYQDAVSAGQPPVQPPVHQVVVLGALLRGR